MFALLTPKLADAPKVGAPAPSLLWRALAFESERHAHSQADRQTTARVFLLPQDAGGILTATDALSILDALDDATKISQPLLLVSHLDAVGDRGGVIVEGLRCPTGAPVALDVDEETAVLARETAHVRARLFHADRQGARQHRVRSALLAAKSPTRGVAWTRAMDAELEREGRSLDAAVLRSRARARGFRTVDGYIAALSETLLGASSSPSVALRLPPIGVAVDPTFSVGPRAEDLPLALEDVVTAIADGARRTAVAPLTRYEMLPVDVAVQAVASAASLLSRDGAGHTAMLGVVTALATTAPPSAPKPPAAKLLTVERVLELVDLAARSGAADDDRTALESVSRVKALLENKILASADLAPTAQTLAQAPAVARRGMAFASSLAKGVSKRTLGGRGRALEPLVDTTVATASAAISRTFGDGRDPFFAQNSVAHSRATDDANGDADASTKSPLHQRARPMVSGLVTSGQRIRAQHLATAPIPFAPVIDWRRYLLDRHLPALKRIAAERKQSASGREAMPAFDTLVDLVTEVSERENQRAAFTRFERGPDGSEQPTTLSYREIAPRARAIAARLIAAGVEVGDRVVLSGDNHPDWALCAFGVSFAGATLVPLDPTLSLEQAHVVLRKARPSLAILDARAQAQFGRLIDEANMGATDAAEGKGGESEADDDVTLAPLGKVRTLALPIAAAPGANVLDNATAQLIQARAPTPDAIASILFTSGTTGEPKGVELSHRNFTSLFASLGAVFDMHKGDRSLSLMPMHHTLEFSCGLMLPLSAGAHIHYIDELSADRLAYALKQGRITGMVGVPALWQLLERKMRSRIDALDPRLQTAFSVAMKANRLAQQEFGQDFGRLVFKPLHDELGGHLRTLISGGAALPPDVHAFFADIGLHLAEGYGLTESAPVLTVAEGGPGEKPGTVGRPIPGVEIRIDAPSEAPGNKGVGEVWAKGPNIMRGYFENQAATDATLSGDGWLRTGDLGRLDNGVLTLVGRAKDVVVTASGENIYLDDTEARIGPIAGIAEQTLLGLDDPRGGERLGFAYVLEGNTDTDTGAARVKKALNKLPETFRPQVVVAVVGPLPKTATRKVKRKDVVPVVESVLAADAKNAPAAGPALSAVRGAIAAACGQDVGTLKANTDLRADLGFDSLLWVEVQDALEPIYGALDADALFSCQTVGDVEQYLRTRTGEAATATTSAGRLSIGASTSARSDDEDRVRIPSPLVAPLRRALSVVQRDVYRSLFETDVTGRTYIPHNRPTIVVSNHTSHLDTGLVKFALGRYGQKLAPLAAKDYFFEGTPLKVAAVEQLTNLVAIERESGSGVAFEQARTAVNAGQVVLIFPEGTRRAEGTIGDFRPLVGRLSLTCDVDVLPLYLDGAFEALPRGSYRPRARQLRVRIGPPLRANAMATLTAGLSGADAARAATDYIREAVCALRDDSIFEVSERGAFRRDAPKPSTAPASHVARV